ncbi:hypothetical protein [Shivajiella indica]|uniref:Uncharacterized protein n=1 Tax=Shivajiella indica TaxID=872115 RepID=A0ABW5B959_9BACT
MKKNDFLDMANESDSLKALVNMFFRKRKNARTGFIVTGGLTVVTLAIAGAVATNEAVFKPISGQAPSESNISAAGTAVFVTFFGGTILSSINLIKYPKAKLNEILERYPDTRQIPEKYRVKIEQRDFY